MLKTGWALLQCGRSCGGAAHAPHLYLGHAAARRHWRAPQARALVRPLPTRTAQRRASLGLPALQQQGALAAARPRPRAAPAAARLRVAIAASVARRPLGALPAVARPRVASVAEYPPMQLCRPRGRLAAGAALKALAEPARRLRARLRPSEDGNRRFFSTAAVVARQGRGRGRVEAGRGEGEASYAPAARASAETVLCLLPRAEPTCCRAFGRESAPPLACR